MASIDQNITIYWAFSFFMTLICNSPLIDIIGLIRLQHILVSGAMLVSLWRGLEA